MYIDKLSLSNFRNYTNQTITFNPSINIIYGNNAQGKTNIIESIFLCSMGKSFRTSKDSELIKFNENRAEVEIEFYKGDRTNKIKAEIESKKTFQYNGIKQNKVSDIVGKINTIIFTPDDISIVKEGPSKRRRFLDMMISSLRPNYIYTLNKYNKVIEQRNNYLKQILNNLADDKLLDILDEQVATYSAEIYKYRIEFYEKIKNYIGDFHKMITNSGKVSVDENVKIHYLSNGSDKESYLEGLVRNRKKDIERGYTSIGVHRDDLLLFIDGKNVGDFGSQGQQRTVTLALKLCELRIVKEEIGDFPILLLDDFMSELDENRRKSFLENIEDCQVILTCTDDIDLKGNVNKYYIEKGNLKLENGTLKKG